MNIKPFSIEDVARVCHEVNRQYCSRYGDNSQLPWVESPEWQKESSISGVKQVLLNPDITPAKSHENWMRDKLADGWTYGPVKDLVLKQHPCMVPYIDLDPVQREKDQLFISTVKEMQAQGVITKSEFVLDNGFISQFDLLTGNRVMKISVEAEAEEGSCVEWIRSILNSVVFG